MFNKTIMTLAFAMFISSSAYAANITMATTLSTSNTGKSVYGAKTGTATTTSPLIGKNSTGVGIGIYTTSAGYSLVTQHVNGTKAFGTSYDSTAIFSKDVTTKGTALLAIPTAITTTDFTTWSSL